MEGSRAWISSTEGAAVESIGREVRLGTTWAMARGQSSTHARKSRGGVRWVESGRGGVVWSARRERERERDLSAGELSRPRVDIGCRPEKAGET
jgi:hypothetical protein